MLAEEGEQEPDTIQVGRRNVAGPDLLEVVIEVEQVGMDDADLGLYGAVGHLDSFMVMVRSNGLVALEAGLIGQQ